MIAPFYQLGLFGFDFSLIIALFIGISFGFFLERGGLGSSPKLAAQFYFTDLTVFKVMFTAVVTAMIGLYWLGYLGAMDLHLVYKSPTYVLPYIIAGLIFGVGFVTSGLCPGTSCVSAATGRIDGLFTLLGIFFGIFVFGETFNCFQNFFYSGSLGTIVLSDLWNINYGLLVFAVIIVALLGFAGVEAIERKITLKLRLKEFGKSKTSFLKILVLITFILGFLAIFTGDPYPKDIIETETTINGKLYQYIQPEELAENIMKRKKNYLLIDVRSPEDFGKYHIPFSKNSFLDNDLTKKKILITGAVFPDGILDSMEPDNTMILFGGIERWKSKIIFPDISRMRKYREEQLKEIRKTSRFFGGRPLNDKIDPRDRRFSKEGCG